jgi:hypothetical protein
MQMKGVSETLIARRTRTPQRRTWRVTAVVFKRWTGLNECEPGCLSAPCIFSGITAAKRTPKLKNMVNGGPISIQKPKKRKHLSLRHSLEVN